MPPTPQKITYHLEQHVELAERETDQTAAVTEIADRQSLLLLSASVDNLQWQRIIEEYILTPKEVGVEVAGKASVLRATLRELHRAHIVRMKVPFGLQIPLVLQTNFANHEPGARTPSNKIIPSSYQAVHLPTYLPELPAGDWALNTAWTGQSKIRYGAAEFTLRHSAQRTSEDSLTLRIDVVAQESMFAKNGFTLTLRPEGSVIVTLSPVDCCPITARGNFHFLVQGQYQARSTQLLDYKNQFSYARVPIPFDDETLHASAWYPG